MRRNLILALCAILSFVACSDYSYPNKKEISEKSGSIYPDSVASFVLEDFEFGGTQWNRKWNPEALNRINRIFENSDEPILHNFYLDRSIYRFVFADNDSTALIINLNSKDKAHWLSAKKIQDQESGDKAYFTYSTRTQNLSDQEWAEFQTLLKSTDIYSITDIPNLNSATSFTFLEAHKKGSYWYVLTENGGKGLSDLSAWVRNKSKMKL